MTAAPGDPGDAPTGGAAQDRDAKGSSAVSPAGDVERDSQVLALREQGRSFASIARALGFDGVTQANAAFMRGLRRLPTFEQENLRSHEMARLSALGERLRQRSDLDETEKQRRGQRLDRLRKRLTA